MALVNPCELLVSNVNKKLGNFLVRHYLLNRKDRLNSALNEDLKQILNVCILGHLNHDVSAEFQTVIQNIGQFWEH
jgi:hypothetical protein